MHTSRLRCTQSPALNSSACGIRSTNKVSVSKIASLHCYANSPRKACIPTFGQSAGFFLKRTHEGQRQMFRRLPALSFHKRLLGVMCRSRTGLTGTGVARHL